MGEVWTGRSTVGCRKTVSPSSALWSIQTFQEVLLSTNGLLSLPNSILLQFYEDIMAQKQDASHQHVISQFWRIIFEVSTIFECFFDHVCLYACCLECFKCFWSAQLGLKQRKGAFLVFLFTFIPLKMFNLMVEKQEEKTSSNSLQFFSHLFVIIFDITA